MDSVSRLTGTEKKCWLQLLQKAGLAPDEAVGQTVLVKDGMVLAVEAFEGTDAAIKRGGRLGGRGAVVFKGAREGHDMRFDVPVMGMRTVKNMKRAGATALVFQAGRQIVLEREKIIAYADRHGIAIAGVETDLPPAPILPT